MQYPQELVDAIRQEWMDSDVSLKQLSRKHNVPIDTLKDWCMRGKRMRKAPSKSVGAKLAANPTTSSSFGTQVGGTHYQHLAIQPNEYITKNNLGWNEANVVKYITRWRSKGGVEDLRKARHYLDMLIEMACSGSVETSTAPAGRATRVWGVPPVSKYDDRL